MSMEYIREYYGVPATRGMPASPKVGPNAGKRGIIRGSRGAYLVLTDTTGRYGWWLAHKPSGLAFSARQDIVPVHWTGWGGGAWENSTSGHKVFDDLTHWMPLPAPPNL
jgi:hypothetical protein